MPQRYESGSTPCHYRHQFEEYGFEFQHMGRIDEAGQRRGMVRGRGGGLDGSNGQIKFVPSQSLDRENREVKLQKPRAMLQNNLSTSLHLHN